MSARGLTRVLARLCLVLALGAPAGAHAQDAGQAPDAAADWPALLEQRAVLVEPITAPGGTAGLRARVCVHAAPERVWSVLLDYAHFPEIFPGIRRLQVLEESAAGARVEFWVDAVLKDVHYVLQRDYERPGRRLSWHRVAGDLQRIDGSWEILGTPEPGSVLLVYDSFVEVGGLVPGAPLRWLAQRRTRQMAEHLREWIEHRPAAELGLGADAGRPTA